MNVKEYISSGIIESYVLGMATEAERKEFESLCASYPEISEARNAFEVSLEELLLKNAQQPPAHLKQKIEDRLAVLSSAATTMDSEEYNAPVKRINAWKWVAAASLILMVGVTYWSINTNKKYRQLQLDNIELQQQLQQTSARLNTINQDMEMLHKPDIKMAAMHGTIDPAMYATIYWDTTSKDVYLLLNNLPQPASDKQYQLWALLNGKPIDLGVFAKQERLLIKMKGVQSAQAFAITLEPMGGSPAPTSNPVVLSKL